MYRPKKIKKHNETLKRFQKWFNNSEPHEIVMCEWAEISRLNDGVIIYKDKQIIFDWECRDDWKSESDKCDFLYPTLGQFERKFDKRKKIELTIQCDKNEKCFIAAWHVDFKSKTKTVKRRTNYEWREIGKFRETEKFRVFRYTQIHEFKHALKRAFEYNLRNHKCFEVRVNEQ
jgi:hypothetical protein